MKFIIVNQKYVWNNKVKIYIDLHITGLWRMNSWTTTIESDPNDHSVEQIENYQFVGFRLNYKNSPNNSIFLANSSRGNVARKVFLILEFCVQQLSYNEITPSESQPSKPIQATEDDANNRLVRSLVRSGCIKHGQRCFGRITRKVVITVTTMMFSLPSTWFMWKK